MKKKPEKKRRKKGSPAAFLFAALFLMVAALVLLRFSGIGAAPGSSSFKDMVGSTQLMQNASLVKQDLKLIVSQMKDNDIIQLEYSSRKLGADVDVLKESISAPIWTVAEIVPVLGQDVKTAKALVDISEILSEDLLKSWVELQKKAPYTEIKTEEGYNDESIRLYLDYLGDNLPTVKSMIDRLDRLNLRLVDEDGKITAAIKMAAPLVEYANDHFSDTIKPGVEFLLDHHPSELKTEEGFNLEMIGQYYSFLLENLPALKVAVEDVNAVDLSMVDKEGKLTAYARLAKPMLGIVEQYADTLLTPGLAMLSEHPLSGIKDEDGIHYDELGVWSDFLHENGDTLEKMLEELHTVDFDTIEKGPKIISYLDLADQLLEPGVLANEKLLRPALQLLNDYPLSAIKVENGYDIRIVLAYLDFAEENLPLIDQLTETLQKTDLSLVDREGKLGAYLDKIVELRDLAMDCKDLIPAARVFLGNGEKNRLYFFPAQNAAEIRASGGFPGNAALVSVTNGILTLGDIVSGYAFYTPRTPQRAKITPQEVRLFTERMYAPWDVDFCIDFERVAQIWAMSVEDTMGLHFDGVISATPVVIQKLLTAFDEPIVLSNGMTLDGTTATRILQRDIYFEYKRAGMNVYPVEDMTDILFSETVSKTLELISGNMDPGHILDYIRILRECIDERIVLFWMSDPDEEEVLREVGWSGSLNSDPEQPKLGIFFSSEQSSKMGYFFDMLPSIGEPVKNADGSSTYDVTLTLGNVISREEERIGGTWILGRYYVGAVVGDLTITAPAGGTITDISMSIPRGMRNEDYHGLDTHYVQWLIIRRGETITVQFKVTTAPNVDAPLEIMATPTLTQYRS